MILVIGLAGSGKSTQCQLLEATGDYRWLSVGQLLRTRINDPEQVAVIEKGDLLDDQIVLPMILDIITPSAGVETPDLLLDGFPRTISQCMWLLEQSEKLKFSITKAIHLIASEETTRSRLIKRGRTDDDDAAISERFNEYESMILPILDCLRSNNVDVIDVNGVNDPEVVHDEILTAVEENNPCSS